MTASRNKREGWYYGKWPAGDRPHGTVRGTKYLTRSNPSGHERTRLQFISLKGNK